MISIKNLIISYSRHTNVIDDLNLDLNKGFIHGIVGLNGSGKTTFLNGIYGLKKPESGSVELDGHRINKKMVSYLVTENYFYSNITGYEYLNLISNKTFDIELWNRLFNLPLNSLIDSYSTGMKKKLALMGILKQDKPLMILDEPFNGLDIETSRIIRMILLRLKEKNKTVIITSHIMETLTNLCDYIHYLESGKIKFTKDKTEFVDFEKEVFEKIESDNAELVNELI